MIQKSVLHDLQKVLISRHPQRAFLMHNGHHQGAAEPVMLGPAFQTLWSLEKLHDKSRNLPDPDIFTFDTVVLRCTAYVTETTTVTTVTQGSSGGATTSASATEADDARTSSEETSSEETGWKGGACVGVLFWFAVITGVALLVAAMAHGAFFWVPSVYQPPKRRTSHAATIPALGPAVQAKNKAVSTRTSGGAAQTAPPRGSQRQQGGDAPAEVDIISEDIERKDAPSS